MADLKTFDSSWRGRVWRYAPLILWTGVVLFASTGSASMSNTSTFIRPLLEFFFPNSSEETLLTYHGYIRKMAHLTEYGILAFFTARALFGSSRTILRKYVYLFVFTAVAFIAVLDEMNQSLNTSRTGSVRDVFIDLAGAIIAISLIYGIQMIRRR